VVRTYETVRPCPQPTSKCVLLGLMIVFSFPLIGFSLYPALANALYPNVAAPGVDEYLRVRVLTALGFAGLAVPVTLGGWLEVRRGATRVLPGFLMPMAASVFIVSLVVAGYRLTLSRAAWGGLPNDVEAMMLVSDLHVHYVPLISAFVLAAVLPFRYRRRG
jgi:hypothetical protein